MHGVVNLHDNNLPARYSYPLPADYQELISQYCDIWTQGIYRSESEIITQLGDLRKRMCDFISFVQERVFDEDIPILEYYCDQANLGDELLRSVGLDSIIDDIEGSTADSYGADSVVSDIVISPHWVSLEGTLPDIYMNWDSSCVWYFLDYLTYFTQF